MITGRLSLLLHLFVIAALCTLATSLVLILLRRPLLDLLNRYDPAARRICLWLVALLPCLVGFWAVILVMLPSLRFALFTDCPSCHVHDLTQEHLCWYHPLSFKVLSWESGFLMCVVMILLRRVWRTLGVAISLDRKARKLLAFADDTPGGYARLDSDIPCAVTVGLMRPRSVISHVVETSLAASELQIVAAHEAEHVRNNDPLKQLVFRLCIAVFPLRFLSDAMELVVEQCADLAVARRIPDRALIAATILKVRKISVSAMAPLAGTGVVSFGAGVVEQRIRLLLADHQGRSLPLPGLILAIGTVIVAGLFFGDIPHHVAEHLVTY
jgi:beta-lactamase regulating signal transducer with metallopeptidase domain